jgi:hypothetical protein
MTLLSDQFCRLEDTNPEGMTALAWSVRRSKWNIASLLVQAGACTHVTNAVMHDVVSKAVAKKSCPAPLKRALVREQPCRAKRCEFIREMCRLSGRITLGMPVQWSEDEPWAAILSKVMGKDGHDLPGIRHAIARFL